MVLIIFFIPWAFFGITVLLKEQDYSNRVQIYSKFCPQERKIWNKLKNSLINIPRCCKFYKIMKCCATIECIGFSDCDYYLIFQVQYEFGEQHVEVFQRIQEYTTDILS